MVGRYDNWLLQLTQLPTAAGREQCVVDWVRSWARRRNSVTLRQDRFGNLLLTRNGPKSNRPLIFTAHMDHPAFVVSECLDDRHVRAEFRGWVFDPYFVGSKVLLYHDRSSPSRGLIESLRPGKQDGGFRADHAVTVAFKKRLRAAPGDVMTWNTGPTRIEAGRLFAPACDDLAGVAAALAAFDALAASRHRLHLDVRLLLTRAEEVGFVGAIAACQARSMPKGSRLIALECSKSFPNDSPIGGGPIVRVGDRTSSFDPDLTYRVCRIAERLGCTEPSFNWQRKLMPGGTCEASAFQAFGYTATCLCLPLGNYHNMRDGSEGGQIVAETISLADYRGLVQLLVAIGKTLDDQDQSPTLRCRLEDIFKARRELLD